MPSDIRILVTLPRPVPDLDAEFDVHYGAIGTCPDATGIVCAPTERLSASDLDEMPKLEVIAVAGAGLDGLDMAAVKARSIKIVSAAEATAIATAELTIGLMLVCARNLVEEMDELRDGRWPGWQFEHAPGRELSGARLGLVGFGRIGRAVSERASAFNMKISHHTRRPTGVAGYVDNLEELLRRSDFLSLHVPLTEETRGLLGARELDLLPDRAIVINTARGEILDEVSLCDRLDDGRVAAAGLDVFQNEPRISERLMKAPHLALTPHLGSATGTARKAMAELAGERLAEALRGH